MKKGLKLTTHTIKLLSKCPILLGLIDYCRNTAIICSTYNFCQNEKIFFPAISCYCILVISETSESLKNLCLSKRSNKENGMLSFGFVILPFMLTFIKKSTVSNKQRLSQTVQQNVARSFLNTSMLLALSRLLFTQLWISLCEISCVLRINFFLTQILYVSYTPLFVIREQLIVCDNRTRAMRKEILGKSQHYGILVLVKVKFNLMISLYSYWFYGQ